VLLWCTQLYRTHELRVRCLLNVILILEIESGDIAGDCYNRGCSTYYSTLIVGSFILNIRIIHRS